MRNLLRETFNTSDAELLRLYKALKANFDKDEWPAEVSTKRDFFKPQDSLSKKDYDRLETVACDLPSLLSRAKGNTVMIVAQDPYSNTSSPKVTVGTPYAMHIRACREKLHTKKYFQLIDVLLQQGYQTYLTDVYKIYIRETKLKKEDCLRFFNLLRQEIETINPIAIVTWGRVATNAVAKLNLQKSHYHYPHPSGAARSAWAKLMQQSATDQNIYNYWKQDILNKLTSNAIEH